jgi:hypothetical protein
MDGLIEGVKPRASDLFRLILPFITSKSDDLHYKFSKPIKNPQVEDTAK